MYSRIPCPEPDWSGENKRYALCFFPSVGLVIGILFVCWQQVCAYFAVGSLLQGAVMMMLPLLVTGGFHMDGFCDVHDALASCAPQERKLEILKDSDVGAFAVIYAVVYLILQTACYAQIVSMRTAAVISCGFVLSRALSGLCAVFFRAAKKEGSLQAFVVPADRKVTIAVLGLIAAAAAAVMILLLPFAGTCAVVAAALCVVHYRNLCYREFGGLTGDCAGWFLINCELAIAAASAAAQIPV